MSLEPATCTIRGIELVAAPPQRPDYCFGCHLFEPIEPAPHRTVKAVLALFSTEDCMAAAPAGHDIVNVGPYCSSHDVIWVRKEDARDPRS